jgi:hypothetical protein
VTYDAVSTQLKRHALSAKKAWDLRHDTKLKFAAGDRVLVIAGTVVDGNHPKAAEPTHGPFTVCKVLPRDNYQLSDLRTRRMHDVVNVSRLIAFPSRQKFSDIEERSRYPVQAIINHRERLVPLGDRSELSSLAGTKIVEYRIRWRGFSRNYDSWRASHYLSDIFELVSAYRAAIVLKGGTFSDVVEPMTSESRDVTVQPEVDPAAIKVRHFRNVGSHHNKLQLDPNLKSKSFSTTVQPDATSTGDSLSGNGVADSAKQLPTAASDGVETAADTAIHDSSLDPYPAGSRIQVQHGDSGWWVGTVKRSFLSRPRLSSAVPKERRIIVAYDAAAYKGELFEHGLRGTPVRSVSNTVPTPLGARTGVSSTPITVPSTADAGTQRLARHQRRIEASILRDSQG